MVDLTAPPPPAPPPPRRGGIKRQLEELSKAMDIENEHKRLATFETRLEEHFNSLASSDLLRGHAIMHAMRTNLDRIDTDEYYRSKDQRLIHHRICAGLSKLAYKSAIRTHELVIKRYNRFESLKSEIFITAPRRGGKTSAIVQAVCAMLVSFPGVNIASFAPSSRAAGVDSGLMGQVRDMLRKTFDIKKFHKHNKEILEIHWENNPNDVRKFKAYSASATDKYVFLSLPHMCAIPGRFFSLFCWGFIKVFISLAHTLFFHYSTSHSLSTYWPG